MKRAIVIPLLLAVLTTGACSSREKIDRTLKTGVEVVLNHIEPYRRPGRPSTFDLRDLYAIDTEDEALAAAGMGSAGEFGVDGQGGITIVAFKNRKDFIYRFDPRGRLIRSFGPYGQGPGEIDWPFLDRVFDDGRVALTDHMRKFVVFDAEGRVAHESRPRTSISHVFPLDDGRLVAEIPRYGTGSGGGYSHPVSLCLCSPDFAEIKELDRYQYPPDGGNEKLLPFFLWRVSAGHIYIANEERGYEILDYDLDGALRRRIRKEYRPAAPSREIKRAILGPAADQPGVARYLPDPMPPIAALFTNDEGRLFVMTYEPGDRRGEFVWDIFDADGVFAGRKSLDIDWLGLRYGSQYALMKDGRFYSRREKESGYYKYSVQTVIWR